MTDAIASMIPLLATVLLHFLWQGALVGVLAWMLCLGILRDPDMALLAGRLRKKTRVPIVDGNA